MLVYNCESLDVDGQTCLQGAWVEVSQFLPALSMDDVRILAGATLTLFAAAWVFKFVRRAF
jgi:hypothetical protein